MGQEKEPDKFFKDMKEWQDNQYMPGYFVGSKAPFPLKQLGKKKWFRSWAVIYLILFGLGLVYAIWQMIEFFSK